MAAQSAEPAIFVLIPSYRDPECHATIEDLFATAKHPDRVFVGVALQCDRKKDASLLKVEYSRPEQVRVKHYPLKEANGAGWARNEAMKLHKGEPYILQIQAHMRFEPGWDESLLGMLERAPSKKAAITGFPPSYTPDGKRDGEDMNMRRIQVHDLASEGDPQLVHFHSELMRDSDPRVGLFPTPFWIGCFLFGKSEMFTSLPFDEHVFFWGEEMSHSARLYTHGWDLFQVDRPVIYHQWIKGGERRPAWEAEGFKDISDQRNQLSYQRLMHYFGVEEAADRKATKDLKKYPLGSERTLESFFEFAGIDLQRRKVTPEAHRGYWHFPLDRKWGKGKILVQIASYRDPECQHTIKDLFERAKHPERIYVALVNQLDEELDQDCLKVPYPYPDQVREWRLHFFEAIGVCWARWCTQKMWRGEEFTLQIDSHMRFAQDWDEKLLEELEMCPSEKSLLSCCIARYTPPYELEPDPKASILRTGKFTEHEKNIRNRGAYLNRYPEKPLNAAFISAGFLFGPSEFMNEVPYDPYLYFDQEEITYAARLFSYGWDVYSTTHPYVYHYYITLKARPRPLPWTDAKDNEKIQKEYSFLRMRGNQRFYHLIGRKLCENPVLIKDLDLFGFGKERSLIDFENYCGLDFVDSRISEYAMRAGFIKDLNSYIGTKVYVPELDDKDKKDKPISKMTEEERIRRLSRSSIEMLRSFPNFNEEVYDRIMSGKPLAKQVAPVRLQKPEPHHKPPQDGTLQKIFVAIPSYRDPECQHTVKDLFDKADHPDRIIVGICWQYDDKEDGHCFQVPYPRPAQVREKRVHYSQAQGMSWARSEALKLAKDEQFVLQIDSHMRFEQGWDTKILECYYRAGREKTALTSFLPGYGNAVPQIDMSDKVTRMRISQMGMPGSPAIIHLGGDIITEGALRWGLYPAPFIVGNFLFGPKRMFDEVPIDPYLYFHGDEITYSARLWTHGYDLYQPDINIAYHLWDTFKKLGKENPKGDTPYKSNKDKRVALTADRVFYLLNLKHEVSAESRKELEQYALGTERTLDSYWSFASIDPVHLAMSENARKGIWPDPKQFLQHRSGTITESAEENMSLPRIFVQIAAYRDKECQYTVKDLFEQAEHPERISVGICWQYDEKEDGDCFKEPYPFPDQVKEIRYDYRQARGAGWARSQAQRLCRGEDYTLQIDAHLRFVKGWDSALIEMLKQAPADKPALTAFLPHYDPGQPLKDMTGKVTRLHVKEINTEKPAQVPFAGKIVNTDDKKYSGIYPTPAYCGHFLFGRTQMFLEVPIDPHMFFNGDEMSKSARLWTHGYTLFQPDRNLAYHYWDTPERHNEKVYKGAHLLQAQKTRERTRHILGIEIAENEESLKDIEAYGHGDARTLDSFWKYIGVDIEKNEVKEEALKGLWAEMEQEEPNKPEGELPKIFVQIAAYRDPECQHTIKDLFEKATHPERINVGICWQFIPEEDGNCFQIPYPRPEQVRTIEVDARKSKGACWARSKVQELYEGEEYTLQIDSHMRFEHGWDESLITMQEQCEKESPKAILTTYPAGYNPPDTIKHRVAYGLVAKQFDKDGIFTMSSRSLPKDPPPSMPVKGAFMGACALFGRGSIIKEVPYDPHLYFFGEEITLSVRFWTHGYDIYHPNYPVMYHCWERTGRRTHFQDHEWKKLNDISFARVRTLLTRERPKYKESAEEIEKYGLGKARTLEDYQMWSGVDFFARKAVPASYVGIFPAIDENGQPVTVPESMRKNIPAAEGPRAVNVNQPAGNLAERKVIDMPRQNNQGQNKAPAVLKPRRPGEGDSSQGGSRRITFSNASCTVYDDFLPEDEFEKLYNLCVTQDYQRINTQGKIKRVWDISNGFPLRSEKTIYYYPEGHERPNDKRTVFPSRTPVDLFVNQVNDTLPEVKNMVGVPGTDGWDHYSVSTWLYPQNTGLSLHDDGSGVYTGAYVYFLNPTWKLHWGGLLLVLSDLSNKAIQKRKREIENGYAYHQSKWLGVTDHEDIAMEDGYAQCVFPKKNRMVFIHNEAFHMVTQVNPSAGDHVRMSLAGFFHRFKDKKKEDEAKKASGSGY